MAKEIRKLPQEVINKIAAGEVVERPASVVKELLENAMDAKATRIKVELEQGGVSLLKVSDNGEGMSKDNLRRAIEAHATSKLANAEDLFGLSTYGFRGEALSSIAAVSQFSIASKNLESKEAWTIDLERTSEPIPHPFSEESFTSITVKNLFCKVPARQKFLKSQQTELRYIIHQVNLAALANESVEMELLHNGKKIIHYGSANLEKRMKDIVGDEMMGGTVAISYEEGELSISGRLAKPSYVHATHSKQWLFVNGRPVFDHLIARWVLESFQTLIPRGYFPAFILFLNINPQAVDVNVHPRKSEVKFLDPTMVRKIVWKVVTGCLAQNTDHIILENEKSKSNINHNFRSSRVRGGLNQERGADSFFEMRKIQQGNEIERKMESYQQEFISGISRNGKNLEARGWKIVGQIKNAFILVEAATGLVILDQHAVSEIINYNRIWTEFESGSVVTQRLLLPLEVNITAEEMNQAESQLETFSRMGWDVAIFSERSLLINAIPKILRNENIEKEFRQVLELSMANDHGTYSDRQKAVLLYTACRSAVMFGDVLTIPEMEALLEKWWDTPNREACEHGRPSVHYVDEPTMLKWFKR